jgi:hypothetical protein
VLDAKNPLEGYATGEYFEIDDLFGFITDENNDMEKHELLALSFIDTVEPLTKMGIDPVQDISPVKIPQLTEFSPNEFSSSEFSFNEFSIPTAPELPWGLDRIDQNDLPLNHHYNPPRRGKGAYVYVLDTGVRKTHKEFGGRVQYGFSYYGKNANDKHGHGTHVMSTVLGKTVGVSNQARGVGVKVLDDNGGGHSGSVIKGIEWAVKDIKKKKRCGLLSMSLGGGVDKAINAAVNAASRAGIRVIVAAGNSNKDACNYSPASADGQYVVTVGASDKHDKMSRFSNHGNCTDIFAPGSSIIGAGITSDNSYNSKSGTSMACPHVAGAFAMFDVCNMDQKIEHLGNTGKLTGLTPTSPNLLLEIANITVVTIYPTPFPSIYPTHYPTLFPTTTSPTPKKPTSTTTMFRRRNQQADQEADQKANLKEEEITRCCCDENKLCVHPYTPAIISIAVNMFLMCIMLCLCSVGGATRNMGE